MLKASRSLPAVLFALLTAGAVQAQKPDTTRKVADSSARQRGQAIVRNAHRVQWYEAAGVLGIVAVASAVDQPVQRWAQRHRSQTLGDLASVFRQQGEPWYYAGISLGVFGAGLVAGSPDLRRAGRRLGLSVIGSELVTASLKRLVGRSRPNENVGAFSFHPFTSLKDSAGIQTRGAFPSGHATAAFAVATSLSEDINEPVVTVILYGVAAGAAWSRIYDNRHWFSDTVFGSALGIATAKIVAGRWRVFGWKPPSFMVRPTGEMGLQWSIPLRSTDTGG